jgi:hypothetical protein
MKMNIKLLLVFMLMSGIAFSQELLQHNTVPLKVTYSNGSVENYIGDWSALLDVQHWEDGHPAVPLKGWLTDTRQCHWSINGKIIRKLFLTNQAGEQFEKKDLAVVYDSTNANKGSDLQLIGLRPENCGDANERFNSDVNNGRIATRQHFPEVEKNDLETLKAAIRNWPKVTKVE